MHVFDNKKLKEVVFKMRKLYKMLRFPKNERKWPCSPTPNFQMLFTERKHIEKISVEEHK